MLGSQLALDTTENLLLVTLRVHDLLPLTGSHSWLDYCGRRMASLIELAAYRGPAAAQRTSAGRITRVVAVVPHHHPGD